MKYLLLLLPLTVFASGSHHEPRTVVITQAAEVTTVNQVRGIALGIAASQHIFDFGTHSWQWSAGTGSYDNNSAISFGVAKRLDRVLFTGSISTEDGITGYGVGITGRF